MPIYQTLENNSKGRILYVHIPKCAGSYLEQILEKKLGPSLLFNKYRPGFLKLVPQHLTYEEILSLNFQPTNDDYIFTVIRNPYKRIESEFFYQKRIFNISYKTSDFSKWLIRSLKKAQADPYYKNSHFRPQTDFLNEEVTVFKLEDGMEKIISELEKNIGKLEVSDTKINSSKKQEVKWSNRALVKFNQFYKNDFFTLDYPILTEIS